MEASNQQSGTIIASNAEVASKSNKTLKTCFSQASMEDSDDHQSTQLGALIGSNEDLLTEILIRLPVTSILRFKSVSKHWQLLLSNSHLTHRYDNNSLSKSPLGLFGHCNLRNTNEPRAKSLYIPFDVKNPSTPLFGSSLNDYLNRSNVTIEQSCNGLLLCSVPYNGAREYYVFNPTTRQLAFIPPVPGGHDRFMALAFHQTHCVHYKVVCILDLYPNRDSIQVRVYSSDTRTWKMCFESFSLPDPFFYHPVYWNGAVYWSPFSKLLQFKLDAEELQMLPLPVEMMTNTSCIMYIGESSGHLHLIFLTEGEEYILHVYEMLTDHSGWFVKYRLQFDRLLRDCPFLFHHYKRVGIFGEVEHRYQSVFEVVDVVRGKEEEDSFLVLSSEGKILVRYNFHDKSVKEFYRSNDYYLYPSRCHSYIETLSAF